MTKILKLYRGHRFLGGRSVAHEVRRRAEDLLASNRSLVVVLDFSDIEGVSHSFADELLTPLSELLEEGNQERVYLRNCSSEVFEDLELIAAMHGLRMPAIHKKAQAVQ